MRVTAWNNGGTVYGVRVGAANRKEYFGHLRRLCERGSTVVEIIIDELTHSFELTDGFWDDCPEIRDRGEPILREWWAREYGLPWPAHRPHEAELTPLRDGRFRLQRRDAGAAS